MELGNPTESGSRDAAQSPSMPLVLPLADMQLHPPPSNSPKLDLFQQLVLTIEKSNAEEVTQSLPAKV